MTKLSPLPANPINKLCRVLFPPLPSLSLSQGSGFMCARFPYSPRPQLLRKGSWRWMQNSSEPYFGPLVPSSGERAPRPRARGCHPGIPRPKTKLEWQMAMGPPSCPPGTFSPSDWTPPPAPGRHEGVRVGVRLQGAEGGRAPGAPVGGDPQVPPHGGLLPSGRARAPHRNPVQHSVIGGGGWHHATAVNCIRLSDS